jgi:predicted  nucleic acid-binding Zn-ribbon protein
VRLQELSTAARNGRRIVEEAPSKIEEIEARFRERNTEYVALKDRHDELEADTNRRNGELSTLEESRKKYRADLMQVQNQREYAAMLKEIDSIQAQIGEHEEAVLKAMDELETLKVDLEKFAEHIEQERKEVAKEIREVEAGVAEAKTTITASEQQRAEIEGELPRSLVATVHRLEPGRQGLFLTKAEDGTCLACYVRVRPQAYQEIRTANAIHTCSNCKRLLYYEPVLADALAQMRSPGTEAADSPAGDDEAAPESDTETQAAVAPTEIPESAPAAPSNEPATDAGIGG